MTEVNKPVSHPTDKGKLPLVEANPVSLAQLTPTDVNKTIEARVYRKWIAKKVKTQVASNFCAILLDRESVLPGQVKDMELNATFATHYYLNPDLPEANYILSVYADLINPTPALEIQREPCNNEQDEQMRNRHTIESVLSVNPQHYQAIIDDGTATATLTCFSPQTYTFVPDCNTVLASAKDKDTYHMPVALTQAEALLALPPTHTTASPAAEVLELPSSSKKGTPDTVRSSEATEHTAEQQTHNLETQKKPVKCPLFQQANTEAKKQRQDE
nr:hypothetical protein [Tanacetum cinerariifolium]